MKNCMKLCEEKAAWKKKLFENKYLFQALDCEHKTELMSRDYKKSTQKFYIYENYWSFVFRDLINISVLDIYKEENFYFKVTYHSL